VESPFKTGPAPGRVPKSTPPGEARLKDLRGQQGRAQRRIVTWGVVALAVAGIGYRMLQEIGTGNPWPVLILINAGFAALIGSEADKRGRSWVLYAAVTLIGTPILALILPAIDGGNRPKKS